MNFLERMLDMLTSAYARKPDSNIGKFYGLLAGALDHLYNVLVAVRLMRDVDCAEGASLDRWGLNLGVQREGAGDGFYRLMIKLKMAALLSGGDTDTIIEVIATLFGLEPEDVEYYDKYPAKIWAVVPKEAFDALQVPDPGTAARFLKRIVAAGIWLKLILREEFEPQGEVHVAAAACMCEFYEV